MEDHGQAIGNGMIVYGENNFGNAHAANILPAHNGANVFVRKLSNRAGCVENDITPSGTPVASVMSPSGGGNHDIFVIMDSVTPVVGTQDSAQQFDTYSGPNGPRQQYIGYTFPSAVKIGRVTFTEGKSFGNGGWWDVGPTIEVNVGGVWTSAEGLRCSPRYEATDHEEASSFETFVLTFDVSDSCIQLLLLCHLCRFCGCWCFPYS